MNLFNTGIFQKKAIRLHQSACAKIYRTHTKTWNISLGKSRKCLAQICLWAELSLRQIYGT